MSEAADLEAGVRAYLLSDSALNALVEGRIFGGELPAAQTKFMPRRALVIKGSGGASLTGGSYVEHDTERLDLFAFGATPREAGLVMRPAALAMKRLKRSVHAGVLLHWARNAGGSSSGREPGTEWPRKFQSFQVHHGLVAVSN